MQASDVTIIGAGPVGLGLAIELAQRDIRVKLVEKYPEPQRVPKGQNLTQRTGEHFLSWGVSNAIRAASPIPAEYGNEGLVAYGSLLSGYHYDWFKRASVREYYAADNERLPQYETERVLRNRISELHNVELLTGWVFDDYIQHSDEVRTTIKTKSGQETQLLTSSFLVGCDGARSPVREAAGIKQTIDQHGRRMALLVFNSEELHAILEEPFPGKTIFNAVHPELEGYWQFLGRVDLEYNWFFHAPVPSDADIDTFDFTSLLHQAVGANFSIRFDYVGFWDLRFTHADTYRSGRVFIAGDAAHSHPPYGGFGVNTGFEDARNLGWKMAAVLRGTASNSLLDSYTCERHPVFASTRDDFIANMIHNDAQFVESFRPDKNLHEFEKAWKKRAAGGQTQVQGYVPHYKGSPIIFNCPAITDSRTSSSATNNVISPSATGFHSHKAEAGAHLSPQVLSDGRHVYELLGTEHALIVINGTGTKSIETRRDEIVELFEQAANTLQKPLTIIKSEPTKETDRWEASIILVRPDHFIAFAGNKLDIDPVELLMHCFGNH